METEAVCRLDRTLWDIPDRRGRKGRQYPLRSMLCLMLAAMVSGVDDLMAGFRWGRRLPAQALDQIGLTQAPCHATYHDFFKAFDLASGEQVLGVWSRNGAPLGHVAIDGKRRTTRLRRKPLTRH